MSAYPTNQLTRPEASPRLVSQLIAGTAIRIAYETPNVRSARVTSIWMVNGGATRTTVRIHHVQQKDTPAQRNAIVYDLQLPAYSTTIIDSEIPMIAGESIHVLASIASSVTIHIYASELP